MDRWAASYRGRAHFVCVGCAGPALARDFVKQLKLSECTTGFANDEMPAWGQLGCNGLIVLDAALRVAVPATAAFMEVRGQAFKHVELLLDALCAGRSVPPLVRLSGLRKRHELNGALGVVSKPAAVDGARCGVKLLRGGEFSLSPANLLPAVDAGAEAAAADDAEAMPAEHGCNDATGS